jgi:hypothetical protein
LVFCTKTNLATLEINSALPFLTGDFVESLPIFSFDCHPRFGALTEQKGVQLENFGALCWPNLPVSRVTRDRCYDFLNIFAKKFSEKIGVFDSKQS